MTLARRTEPRESLERVDYVLLALMSGPPWREKLGFAGLTLVASN